MPIRFCDIQNGDSCSYWVVGGDALVEVYVGVQLSRTAADDEHQWSLPDLGRSVGVEPVPPECRNG